MLITQVNNIILIGPLIHVLWIYITCNRLQFNHIVVKYSKNLQNDLFYAVRAQFAEKTFLILA